MSIFSHPFKKLTLLGALAGGYVLGARAGRERYEQIRNAAQQVRDDPRVQEATAKAETVARETATVVGDVAKEKASSVAETAKEKASSLGDSVSETVDDVADKASSDSSSTDSDGDAVHPLLADEHVATEDEVVYSSGPDIEETVDELSPTDDSDRL